MVHLRRTWRSGSASALVAAGLMLAMAAGPALGRGTRAAGGERWERRAKAPGLAVWQREAYRQVARLHEASYPQSDHWGGIFPPLSRADSQDPWAVLYHLGMKVLPILAEALDDTTPTRTITQPQHRKREVWRVNRLVASLIRYITDREFEVQHGEEAVQLWQIGEYPELGPQFGRAVREYYHRSGRKTLVQRKVEEVEDTVSLNRLEAMRWLGKKRRPEGVMALRQRIALIVGQEMTARNSTFDTEVSAAAVALGKIGGKGALASVKAACGYLRRGAERGIVYDPQLRYAFQAYHAYATLASPEAARAELNDLHRKVAAQLSPETEAEFEKLLQEASFW